MLWEMLAARRMWHGMTEVEIVAHLAAGGRMPPLPADAALPPGLDAICARALDTDPDRRYQTAAELEMDLEGVLVGIADSHARNLGRSCRSPSRRSAPNGRRSSSAACGEPSRWRR